MTDPIALPTREHRPRQLAEGEVHECEVIRLDAVRERRRLIRELLEEILPRPIPQARQTTLGQLPE